MTAVSEELVMAARAGDGVAYAAIVRAETPAAYRLALSIVRSPVDAEDVLQEAFLRAWRDIRRLKKTDAWAAWFRRVLVRSALDHSRRRPRVREIELQDAVDTTALVDLDASDRVALMTAFDKLAPEDRAILALRFFADLEVGDAADALGIPLGTAKSRLHRALGRLRAQLRQEP